MTINKLTLYDINTTLEDAAGFYWENYFGEFTNINFNYMQSRKLLLYVKFNFSSEFWELSKSRKKFV